MGARRDATHVGGGSQPEERHGLAAEVHKIIPRRKPQYGGVSKKYFRTHHILRSGDSIRVFDQPLPKSIPGNRWAASSIVPRFVAMVHCSYRRLPNNVNHTEGYGRPQRDGTSLGRRPAENKGHEQNSSMEARALVGHRLSLRNFFFLAPEGGGKLG
jgi:hypothetical protein